MTGAVRGWGLQPVQDAAGSPAWVRRTLLVVTGALVLFGLLSVYSASSFAAQQAGLPGSHFLVNQFARAVLGAACLFAATLVDYRLYRRLAWPVLLLVVALLTLVLLPGTTEWAPPRNGARRWIEVGPITLQPSELAKVALVLWVADLAVRKGGRIRSFRDGVLPCLLIAGPILLLILLEPHLSAGLIVTALVAFVLFAAGMRIRHFLATGLAAAPLLFLYIRSNPYQLDRIFAFNNPTEDLTGVGYQVEQARIAVGAGKVFGVGFGESTQKLQYVPEPHNDFIFPIIAEEWGFVGAVVLLALFLLWTMLGLRIASSAPDEFGRLLAVGLTGIVAIGAFAHIGITMGLLPTTGVSLPFVSAGGTGLVIALGVTGVLFNIASKRRC